MSALAHKTPHFYFKITLTLSLLFFALGGAAQAQEGTSQAAAARTRYLAEAGLLPSSREIVVEEFVNYHRHQIGRPKAGEAVLLDVRWGNDRVPGPGQEAVLQVGFSTALSNERQDLRPINMALVIDRSGSMADLDKITRVKEALLELVSELRETDILSIVVFDSDAQVLLPARPLGDREYVRRLIRSIEPGSSTNLHAGLMLGYHEALKNYRRDATNRVILLTDGIANQGVTDPAAIARNSVAFNDRGIDLSTIGVGLDLNKDLLRQLAKSGRGLFHFVAADEDIKKVFVKEVQSLVSPVAGEPNVEITYDPALELAQVYGYEPRLRDGAVTIKLDNMNQGLTQVVLLRFRLARWARDNARLPVRVRFTYYDLERKRQITRTEESFIEIAEGVRGGMLKDTEVSKNYTIAMLAQAIHDMAVEFEARRFQEAENRLTDALSEAYYSYPHLEDEDIARNVMIAKRYQDILRRYNQQGEPRNNR
jgi:Ca-activated chloride channel family protein